MTSDQNGEANPDFDNSGAPETFFIRNKKIFDKWDTHTVILISLGSCSYLDTQSKIFFAFLDGIAKTRGPSATSASRSSCSGSSWPWCSSTHWSWPRSIMASPSGWMISRSTQTSPSSVCSPSRCCWRCMLLGSAATCCHFSTNLTSLSSWVPLENTF